MNEGFDGLDGFDGFDGFDSFDSFDGFDGSTLRELLSHQVADRGGTRAPTEAIVAAGRRRVAVRRVAVAGAALAIVAVVPLAATAIASGPRAGRSAATGADPAVSAPTYSTSANGLPTVPVPVSSGVFQGKRWTISIVGNAGSAVADPDEHCAYLSLDEDGVTVVSHGLDQAYCLSNGVMYAPNVAHSADSALQDARVGSFATVGSVVSFLVPPNVTRVVERVDGEVPLSVATVPAPGFPSLRLFAAPLYNQAKPVTFDNYDGHGKRTAGTTLPYDALSMSASPAAAVTGPIGVTTTLP